MKPILFKTDMVRAILDGRKSMTRRVVEPQPVDVYCYGELHHSDPFNNNSPYVAAAEAENYGCVQMLPPYQPRDILYVRETWTSLAGSYIYKADQKAGMKNPGKWHPSIHMPKEAARLFLRVTDIRAERLQEITEEQAEAEGCRALIRSARYNFGSLWDSTIKKADLPRYGWNANPWVWVISFERISKEEALAVGKENP